MDAIVFDLGLSSMQLESSGRGFSFRFDEPLDMRFDPHPDMPTAADLLNSLPEGELERILREYGEEPRARRLARTIVQRRAQRPFERTGDLVAAVTAALGPARGRIHPATRTFQALRIAVNDELEALEAGLDAALRLLKPGGRMAVISFQSLEDRIVKWRFRGWADAGLLQILTRKPLVPTLDEIRTKPPGAQRQAAGRRTNRDTMINNETNLTVTQRRRLLGGKTGTRPRGDNGVSPPPRAALAVAVRTRPVRPAALEWQDARLPLLRPLWATGVAAVDAAGRQPGGADVPAPGQRRGRDRL